MRLTLRTLLAYLDDTLEPSQAKLIGQKVAESDKAQELIERIKQVTRRRRLAVPPATGPGAKIDPNTVAEYLDNELEPDQLPEVEEICLASDVHLAEIAACHQILTLVVGEPAKVPPMSRQRMYGLIKGRESIPYRKAVAGVGAGKARVSDDAAEADEKLLLGMRPSGWFRWLAAAAGVLVLLVVVVVIVRQSLSNIEPETGAKRNASLNEPAPFELLPPPAPEEAEQPANGEKPPDDGQKPPDDGQKPPTDVVKNPTSELPINFKPNMERRPVGKYKVEMPTTSILLERQPSAREPWKRLVRENLIQTGSQLVSLPGYRSEIRLENGVHMLLWGNLPEFSAMPPVLESSVTLHVPDAKANPKIDLDFTLHTGRVLISNHKPSGEAHIRLRFHDDFASPATFAFLIAALEHEKSAVREMAYKYLAFLCPEEAKQVRFVPLADAIQRQEMVRGWKKLIPDAELPSQLHFQPEVWDLTLKDDQGQVSVEYYGESSVRFTKEPSDQSGPNAIVVLLGLTGPAELKAGYITHALPSPCWYRWESYNRSAARTPQNLKAMPDWWLNKVPPQSPRVQAATASLNQLHGRLIKPKAELDLVLAETRQERDTVSRRLGVMCLGAVADLPGVVDALGDEQQADYRDAAHYFLRNWMGRHAENDFKLYVALHDKGYTDVQAETVLGLLHGFSEEDLASPETYEVLLAYLRHEKLAIRGLAHFNLLFLIKDGAKIAYDPGGETAQRDAGAAAWRQLAIKKKLIPDPNAPKEKLKPGAKG